MLVVVTVLNIITVFLGIFLVIRLMVIVQQIQIHLLPLSIRNLEILMMLFGNIHVKIINGQVHILVIMVKIHIFIIYQKRLEKLLLLMI